MLNALLLLPLAFSAQDGPQAVDTAARERAFSEMLSNAVLVGHFTDDSADASELQEEKYTLGDVTPVAGNPGKS